MTPQQTKDLAELEAIAVRLRVTLAPGHRRTEIVAETLRSVREGVLDPSTPLTMARRFDREVRAGWRRYGDAPGWERP